MRLRCEVQVSDHQLCVKKPGKAAFTQVSVGRKPGYKGKDDPIYVMLCTAQNRNGTKYVIYKNLVQIFGKFVKDGKATVRFLNPPHDLAFSKADPEQLTTFLRVIKLVAQGKDLPNDSFSSLAPASTKHVERPVTDLSITKPSEYPVSFPKTLSNLQISNCCLKRVSPSICSLVQLTKLDLSSNKLSVLPDQLCNLQNLNWINLEQNAFVLFPSVLCMSDLRKTIQVIDLRHNEMKSVPKCIRKCEQLATLHLCFNQLETLPECLGSMTSLATLTASHNQLTVLPGSFALKTWTVVDFSNNPFKKCGTKIISPQMESFRMPTLVEIVARAVIKHGVQYTAEDLDRYSIQYLEGAHTCPLCGSACFEASAKCLWTKNLNAVTTYQNEVPLQMYLCSPRCMGRIQRRKP